MRPRPHDLFGDVVVTVADIDAWLIAVPRIDPRSRRAFYYVKDYNVVGKIKAAKLAGNFDEIVSRPPEPSPWWWDRFSWTR